MHLELSEGSPELHRFLDALARGKSEGSPACSPPQLSKRSRVEEGLSLGTPASEGDVMSAIQIHWPSATDEQLDR